MGKGNEFSVFNRKTFVLPCAELIISQKKHIGNAQFPISRYVYDADGDPLQTFDVDNKENVEEFEMVELDILSNHGNLEYTCLYRFRVHGRNK